MAHRQGSGPRDRRRFRGAASCAAGTPALLAHLLRRLAVRPPVLSAAQLDAMAADARRADGSPASHPPSFDDGRQTGRHRPRPRVARRFPPASSGGSQDRIIPWTSRAPGAEPGRAPPRSRTPATCRTGISRERSPRSSTETGPQTTREPKQKKGDFHDRKSIAARRDRRAGTPLGGLGGGLGGRTRRRAARAVRVRQHARPSRRTASRCRLAVIAQQMAAQSDVRSLGRVPAMAENHRARQEMACHA